MEAEAEAEAELIARLLKDTLSFDANTVRAATDALDRTSPIPSFPYHLLSIATGSGEQGLKVAAATYLKNFTRRNLEGDNPQSNVSKEFKDKLLQALLQVEPEILKVLVEVFRLVSNAEFVKRDLWPELVPKLQLAIQNSDQISNRMDCGWKTVNVLTVLQAVIRPFQYFLNPKIAVEPVPPQLEVIVGEIVVPCLAVFHNIVDKVKTAPDMKEVDLEKILLLVCKCIYFSVRSHMPSSLAPHITSVCHDLIGILDSLSFDPVVVPGNEYFLRLKTAKRSLLIFCALITRHRKHSDRLMPDIISCVLKIVKYSIIIHKLDFLPERIISLAFDVISRVLETGPGWRLISPHFSSLLDSAIFPALVMNEKDLVEWEEDADEYIWKNLPSDLEKLSGWRDDLFSARKSAINLLGVISMSKGPPGGSSSNSSTLLKRKKGEKGKRNNQHPPMGELLVLPFLSKFPLPTNDNAYQSKVLHNYFGVLMAYGGLLEFLRDQKPGYMETLIRARLLPLYMISERVPYLIANANWVLGELAPCLPEEMSSDIYSSLLKALTMVDAPDTTCYPARVTAAGAISKLIENDYQPPEWLPLLQIVIGRIGYEEEESCILFQLVSSIIESGNESVAVHIPDIILSLIGAISKYLPPNMEPWPQVVERGFETLAAIAHSWESFVVEESDENGSSEKWAIGQATIGRAFSVLLQEAWLKQMQTDLEVQIPVSPSCIDYSSTLLKSIILSVTGSNMVTEFKVSELLSVWSNLIADYHAWEESEDLSIFDCIKETVNLYTKYGLADFITGRMPSPPAPPVPRISIIEGIGAFISEAIAQYPSATGRASSCVHMLLYMPNYGSESELGVKQSLAITFSRAAFSRFQEIQTKPSALWRPLLLAISSCYLCYPEMVEHILNKIQEGGYTMWAAALCSVASSSFEPKLSRTSDMKLLAMAMGKVIERLLEQGKPRTGLVNNCFMLLLKVTVKLKEVQEGIEDEDMGEDEDDTYSGDEDSEDEDDEDSEFEDDEIEETQEEFLERYARVAAELENGLDVEEEDVEDQDNEPELGFLEGVDTTRAVFSLIERHHNVLIKDQVLPSELVSNIIKSFPEHSSLFSPSR